MAVRGSDSKSKQSVLCLKEEIPNAMESFVMHQGDKIPKHKSHLSEKKNGFAQLR